jgi:hypothetical protein
VVAAVVSSRDGEARGGEMEKGKGKGKEGIDDVDGRGEEEVWRVAEADVDRR